MMVFTASSPGAARRAEVIDVVQFRWAARSHVGAVRTSNEDAAFASPALLAVADGVGGSAAGEVASATAIYVTASLGAETLVDDPMRTLWRAVVESQRQVRAGVVADGGRRGMATTLTAVLTDGHRTCLAHLGDSRAYRLRQGTLTQVSTDHTLVQAMVDAGRLTPAEAAASPQRHIVLQAVSAEVEPKPQLAWLDVLPGDRLLLCSDGLSDLVHHDLLGALLAVESPDAAADFLVDAALHNGGPDNITCVVGDVLVGVAGAPAGDQLGESLGAAAEAGNVVTSAYHQLARTA